MQMKEKMLMCKLSNEMLLHPTKQWHACLPVERSCREGVARKEEKVEMRLKLKLKLLENFEVVVKG